MADNMKLWNSWRRPDPKFLKPIGYGPDLTDIKPIFRYESLTRELGVCGFGWKYTIDKQWESTMPDGQIVVFSQVSVYVREGQKGAWSEPISAVGSGMLYEKKGTGMKIDRESYKKSITDALGKACEPLGVGGDVYQGLFNNDSMAYSGPPVASKAKSSTTVNGEVLPPKNKDHQWMSKLNKCTEVGMIYDLLVNWEDAKPITPETAKDWANVLEYAINVCNVRQWVDKSWNTASGDTISMIATIDSINDRIADAMGVKS